MKADREKVLRLLKTAKGQIDGIIKMVEDDRYCLEISTQLSAAGAVLKSANNEVIKGHMRSCVKNALLSGEDNTDKHVSELIALFEKLNS